ncbi:MAG: hypothetical protein NTY66_00925 [Candidatus Vogelbacteria bacterium]|nr:hypothetical protein [Candidatus Vogelbacteria bacterium]
MPKWLSICYKICLYGFALAGFFLIAGWLAVKFHLTDTAGGVDVNDRYLARLAGSFNEKVATDPARLATDLCRVGVLKKFYPANAGKIQAEYERTRSGALLFKMIAAAEMYALADKEYVKESLKCAEEKSSAEQLLSSLGPSNLYAWVGTPEWQTIASALAKDQEVIARVAAETKIPARLIAAQIVGEQIRLFKDNREVFKQFFQPLKILGNEVKFSLGVAGIKEETAKAIEQNLTDKTSPMYLGEDDEKLLVFVAANRDEERFNRLTDPDNRYYSYLYTALFLKQIEKQWRDAGFAIADRPEILSTIFNVGFEKSVPKADPQVGGSEIELGGRTYTFGGLAYEFYYSGELAGEFPLVDTIGHSPKL